MNGTAQKRGRGRPTKLTPELIENAALYLTEGNYVECVCDLLRITKPSFYAWLETGEADAECGKDTLDAEFFNACKTAIAEAERSAVAQLRAGGRNWMGASEFLARRFRDRWHRSEKVTIDGTLKHEVSGLRDSLLAELSRDMAAIQS